MYTIAETSRQQILVGVCPVAGLAMQQETQLACVGSKLSLTVGSLDACGEQAFSDVAMQDLTLIVGRERQGVWGLQGGKNVGRHCWGTQE